MQTEPLVPQKLGAASATSAIASMIAWLAATQVDVHPEGMPRWYTPLENCVGKPLLKSKFEMRLVCALDNT